MKKLTGYLSNGKTRNYYFVELPESSNGRYIIKTEEVPTNEFVNTIWVLETMILKRKPLKVKFKKKANFTILEEKNNKGNNIWTTDYLEEQTSQFDYVSHFKGKVLVGGLGIGLIIKYLEDLKDVTEIVVVENQKQIIDLAKPVLDTCKKTRVVHRDLYKYLKNCKDRFNYAYYDIWQEANKIAYTTQVIPLRYLSEGVVKDKNIVCWAEDIMKA